MEEVIALLQGYETFYHVTCVANLGSIIAHGLQPRAYDEIDWCAPEDRQGQICFTTHPHLEGMQEQMRDRCATQVVTLAIPAILLAQKNLGLDFTHGGVCHLRELAPLQAFQEMIDVCGTIACFEPIPFAELQIV